jgi:hypothetical protein
MGINLNSCLIHNRCLAYSQMTKDVKESPCLLQSQLVSSSFICHSKMIKKALKGTLTLVIFVRGLLVVCLNTNIV